MKHKFWFLCLLKLKYTTIDKHLIATGYSNFLAQFSVSLNNIMSAYISIIIIVIAITIIIIIIITTVFITFCIVIILILLLLLLLLLLLYLIIPLSTKLTKWPNTLRQFVSNLSTKCLSVFGHFVGLALKGLLLLMLSIATRKIVLL